MTNAVPVYLGCDPRAEVRRGRNWMKEMVRSQPDAGPQQ
jgi:hypothetical protein